MSIYINETMAYQDEWREELEKKICYSGQIIALFVSNNYYIQTAKGILICRN